MSGRACARTATVALVVIGVLLPAADCGAAVVRVTASDMAVMRNPASPAEHRVLLEFDLPEYLARGTVEIAMLELGIAVSSPDTLAGVALDCFAVTAPWTSGTADWTGAWNTAGGDFDRTRHAGWGAAPGDASFVRFDLTGMVAEWASGAVENHGVIVAVAAGELGALSFARASLGSHAKPSLTIWYSPVRDE